MSGTFPKKSCPGCGRMIATRNKQGSAKHRMPHLCPHGRPCVFGHRLANNGLNPGNLRHLIACPDCFKAYREKENANR